MATAPTQPTFTVSQRLLRGYGPLAVFAVLLLLMSLLVPSKSPTKVNAAGAGSDTGDVGIVGGTEGAAGTAGDATGAAGGGAGGAGGGGGRGSGWGRGRSQAGCWGCGCGGQEPVHRPQGPGAG